MSDDEQTLARMAELLGMIREYRAEQVAIETENAALQKRWAECKGRLEASRDRLRRLIP